MKRFVLWIGVMAYAVCGFSQAQEAQQLLLNVEKLAQFKQTLQNLKTGYQVLYKGYTGIKNLSEGNFSLHKTFLDALFEVSPVVRKYKRVADIITYQLRIVKEFRQAYSEIRARNVFTLDEIDYLGKVYGNLFDESVRCLDELVMVITANQLRMSDDERLQAIDRVYSKVMDQYTFLQEFNNSTNMLSVQRKSEQAEIELGRRLRGQ